MSIKSVGIVAAISFLAVPGMALAGSFAVATQNVHVRAGPDVGYPSLDVARAGDDIYVYGCLRYEPWCDVDYDGLRGWISSHYLAFYDGGYRYVGQQAVYRMRAPVITFSISNYWDRHYRGRYLCEGRLLLQLAGLYGHVVYQRREAGYSGACQYRHPRSLKWRDDHRRTPARVRSPERCRVQLPFEFSRHRWSRVPQSARSAAHLQRRPIAGGWGNGGGAQQFAVQREGARLAVEDAVRQRPCQRIGSEELEHGGALRLELEGRTLRRVPIESRRAPADPAAQFLDLEPRPMHVVGGEDLAHAEVRVHLESLG